MEVKHFHLKKCCHFWQSIRNLVSPLSGKSPKVSIRIAPVLDSYNPLCNQMGYVAHHNSQENNWKYDLRKICGNSITIGIVIFCNYHREIWIIISCMTSKPNFCSLWRWNADTLEKRRVYTICHSTGLLFREFTSIWSQQQGKAYFVPGVFWHSAHALNSASAGSCATIVIKLVILPN